MNEEKLKEILSSADTELIILFLNYLEKETNCPIFFNEYKLFFATIYPQMPQTTISDWIEIFQTAMNQTFLKITGVRISEIPEIINIFRNLKTITIENTDIDKLPNAIGNLDNLEALFLSRNKINLIPPSIVNCKKLKTIQLFSNCLTTLPSTINQLQINTVLYLGRNNFDESTKNLLKTMKNIKIWEL